MLLTVPRAFSHEGMGAQLFLISQEIKSHPGRPELYLQRGELYYHSGEFGKSLTDFERSLSLSPDFEGSIARFLRARSLYSLGCATDAIEELNRFITLRPDHAEAYLYRARCESKLGFNDAAKSDYDRALQLTPSTPPELYIERAEFLASLSNADIDESLGGLDQGIAILGPVPTLQLCAIEIGARNGRFEDALKRLDTLSGQGKRQAQWLVRRGELLAQAGKTKEAQNAFEKARTELTSINPARQSKAALELRERISRALEGKTP